MPDQRVRVAIVEDQKMVREGLRDLIAKTPGLDLVGVFGNMEDALIHLPHPPPDIMLIDIGLPGMSGIDGVRRIRAREKAIDILILTVHDEDDQVFQALCAGACGYLLKGTPPAKLAEAIQELARGGAPMSPEVARKVVTMFRRLPPLTPTEHLSSREMDVLQLLADGHSYKTGAAAVGVSVDTVRFHLRNIYRKLHVHSKSEAVLKALRAGLIR